MSKCPVDHKAEGGDGRPGYEPSDRMTEARQGCPVDHQNMSSANLASFKNLAANEEGKSVLQGGCPVRSRNIAEDGKVYDVYGQEIDPSNMMPTIPNEVPAPGQKTRLSTDREMSGIPKSGTDETWVYPSPQMFYNSLKRKGKADGIEEEDMKHVVAAHNTVNEKTWEEIKKWESDFHCNCENPKLKKFMARPHDLSPSARFRMWFRGYTKPFDRHDWIVDRCGEDVRYVIDYYDDPINVVQLHVRPAMDSAGAIWDRVRRRMDTVAESARGIFGSALDPIGESKPKESFTPGVKPQLHVIRGNRIDQSEFDHLSSLSVPRVLEVSQNVRTKCEAAVKALMKCKESGNCEEARIGWEYCVAQEMCPKQATAFMNSLEDGTKADNTGEAYGDMVGCIERFSIVSRRVLAEAANVKQSGPEFPIGLASVCEDLQRREPA